MGTSNTTWVAGLLVVAIIVSALGTLTAVTKSTGFVTEQSGTTNATVTASAILTMYIDAIDFESINVNQTLNASSLDKYFEMRNDGNANINITTNATALWTRQTTTSDKYRFRCYADAENACPSGSADSWTEMPISDTAVPVVANMAWNETSDVFADVDIETTAPTDEPAGGRSSNVYFTGFLA